MKYGARLRAKLFAYSSRTFEPVQVTGRSLMRKALLGIIVISMVNCTSLTEQGAKVALVYKKKIKECKYIGKAEGTSHAPAYFGWNIKSAHAEARNNAAEMGATHAVVLKSGGVLSKEVILKAYDCGHYEPVE